MAALNVAGIRRSNIIAHEAFNQSYSPFIRRDFEIARDHQRDGHYVLTITPRDFVVRTAQPSSLRMNLTPRGTATVWLKALYKSLQPDNVTSIVFGREIVSNVWMLTADIHFD